MRRVTRRLRWSTALLVIVVAALTVSFQQAWSRAAHPPPPAVRLLGLGDSVTAGTGCACPNYVTGLGRLLADRDSRPVTVDNLGASGATTSDLLVALSTDRALQQAVSRADVVVVTIGANDLTDSLDTWHRGACSVGCYQPGVDAMSERLTQAVSAIRKLRSGAPAQILLTTYWNVFADGQVAERAESDGYLAWSDQITRAANQAIRSSAGRTGAACVDLYGPFRAHPGDDPTDLLADDGDHPNPAGTALISRQVLAAVRDLRR